MRLGPDTFLLFVVTTAELKAHALARARHYEERIDFYRVEVKRHEETMAKYEEVKNTDDIAKMSYSNSSNLRDAAKSGLRNASDSAKKFRFISDHLGDATYEITLEEARSLEMI